MSKIGFCVPIWHYIFYGLKIVLAKLKPEDERTKQVFGLLKKVLTKEHIIFFLKNSIQ